MIFGGAGQVKSIVINCKIEGSHFFRRCRFLTTLGPLPCSFAEGILGPVDVKSRILETWKGNVKNNLQKRLAGTSG